MPYEFLKVAYCCDWALLKGCGQICGLCVVVWSGNKCQGFIIDEIRLSICYWFYCIWAGTNIRVCGIDDTRIERKDNFCRHNPAAKIAPVFSLKLLKIWHLPLKFIPRNGAASRQTQGSSTSQTWTSTSINWYLEYDRIIIISARVFRGGLIIRCVCQDSSTTIKSHFASGVRIVAISDINGRINFLALE